MSCIIRPLHLRSIRNAGSLFQSHIRYCSSSNKGGDDKEIRVERENPVSRTLRVLGGDIKRAQNKLFRNFQDEEPDVGRVDGFDEWQDHCDVVIIGGSVVGSSIAYWLKQRAPKALHVVVVEKDSSYKQAAATLSCGGLRQQFSLPENIEMSKFGAEFLRKSKTLLHVEGHDPPDVQFTPQGYLFLASEQGAAQLQENHILQKSLGVKNNLFTGAQLKEKFPWLNTEDVALGCLGTSSEGWFDPWTLLDSFKKKAISMGTKYVEGEAVGFEFNSQPDVLMQGVDMGAYEGLETVIVRRPSGELRTVKFGLAIIACGSNSGNVAGLAKIGKGPGMLTIPLPVEPRKRYVYCVHCPTGPGLDLPFLIDHSGTYVRREGLGGNYICGRSPAENEPEPTTQDFEVDHEYFQSHVWPSLAHRVPNMESLKVQSAWAGHYDYNYIDQNAIIGAHPYYNNLYLATGFSGHGLQQSPAVGRAIMELIMDGYFTTIDLSQFAFDRFLLGNRVLEQNIV